MRNVVAAGTLISLLGFFITLPASAGDLPHVISGPVDRVIDGDTLVIRRRSIRLFGIDAPELDEPGGRDSATHLRRVLNGRNAACAVVHTDSYKRPVAICRAGQTDLGARQIEAGHATEYKFYSQGFYGGN